MPQPIEKTERQAIERHRIELCSRECRNVSFEEALESWHAHHAQKWRDRRQQIMMALQREEMLRHRWIESEKADGDVGKHCYAEWIRDHAASWRVWYQANEEDILREHSLI